MLMPIVSMNKMAMNESVAATCCYREVPTPTAMYWEVLNGGWIGSGYVDQTGWKSGLKDVVNNSALKNIGDATYDATFANLAAVAGELTWQEDPIGSGKYYWFTKGTKGVAVKAADATVALNGVSFGGACAHDSALCKYWESGAELLNNRHFDATTKHTTGGDSWSAPHEAKQHNS